MSAALAPGAAHPFPPQAPDELATAFHVSRDEARRWLDDGCPIGADGRVDPFACHDWLLDGRLERCPALARRWRAWRRWFEPGSAGERARELVWQRTHRLYLPRALRATWWLPTPQAHAGQRLVARRPLRVVDAMSSNADPRFDKIDASGALIEATGEERIVLAPHRVLPIGSAEHAELRDAVEAFAATFRYRYRHHRAGEAISSMRVDGTCLDAAVVLAERLRARGREVLLVSGIVADDVVSNPHFWLLVATSAGLVPVDPAVPAIARLIGAPWRDWLDACVGAHDARRITLRIAARDEVGIAGVPGGATIASTIGEAVADGRNAWSCIDWVCGDCSATFRAVV